MSEAASNFDSRAFRNALGQFCTGVTVVTMKTEGMAEVSGPVRGITVNSFSSVSLSPPLVLVSIDHRADALGILKQSTEFGISVLSSEQKEISNTFAGQQGALEQITFATVNDFPLIPDALAHFICNIHDTVEAGDHSIFIGEVTYFAAKEDGSALLYYKGNYATL